MGFAQIPREDVQSSYRRHVLASPHFIYRGSGQQPKLYALAAPAYGALSVRRTQRPRPHNSKLPPGSALRQWLRTPSECSSPAQQVAWRGPFCPLVLGLDLQPVWRRRTLDLKSVFWLRGLENWFLFWTFDHARCLVVCWTRSIQCFCVEFVLVDWWLFFGVARKGLHWACS